MDLSDEILLTGIKKNNRRDLDQLFIKYYEALCRYSNKFIMDTNACEDIVQAVFIKFWDKRKSININSSLKSYLYTSVRNACFDYIKREVNYDMQELDAVENVSTPDFNNYNYDYKILEDNIAQSIQNLPKKCKIIFELSRYSKLSYAEISEELGISKKTIENQINIALKRIRKNISNLNITTLLFFIQKKLFFRG